MRIRVLLLIKQLLLKSFAFIHTKNTIDVHTQCFFSDLTYIRLKYFIESKQFSSMPCEVLICLDIITWFIALSLSPVRIKIKKYIVFSKLLYLYCLFQHAKNMLKFFNGVRLKPALCALEGITQSVACDLNFSIGVSA
jgi:hypothetical protein